MARRLRIAAAIAQLACASVATAADASRTVVALAWADGFDPDLLGDFTRQTGVRVLVDTYETPAAMSAALRSGRIDIVMLSADALAATVKARLLAPLDAAALARPGTVEPALMSRLGARDADGPHALPFAWSTTGLMVQTDQLTDRHVTLDADNGLEALFKPDILRRLADCGIGVPDDGRNLYGMALAATARGSPPDLGDMRRALADMASLRPLVRLQPAESVIDGVATGALCVGLLSGPAAWQAADRAGTPHRGSTLKWIAPKAGGRLFIDALGLAAAAPNRLDGLRLIAFLMQPASVLRNARFSHGLGATVPGRDNPAEPIDRATLSRSVLVPDDDPALTVALDGWTARKSR